MQKITNIFKKRIVKIVITNLPDWLHTDNNLVKDLNIKQSFSVH